jgi:hypothetical protein
MTLDVTDYPSVAERAAAIGTHIPDGIAILPDNFASAALPADFVYAATSASVRTLLRSNNMSCDLVIPPGQKQTYVSYKNADWIGPVLHLSAALLSDNGNGLSVVLNALAGYLGDICKARPEPTDVRLSFVVEKTTDRTYKRLDYEGTIEGIAELPPAIRAVVDD